LIEIDGIGGATAIDILERLVMISFDDISKEDLVDVDRVTKSNVEAVWMYLCGYYDGKVE